MRMSHSFVSVAKGRVDFLMSPCKVEEHRPEGNTFNGKDWKALWDTGSTGTVITPEIAKAQKISPVSFVIASGVYGAKLAPQYYVDICLPSGTVAYKVLVVEGKPMGCDLLIGMDIINMGDFICSCNNGSTQFGFRTPSEITPDAMDGLLHNKPGTP